MIDLRNNPGGVLEAAVEVADQLLEKGVIVTADGRLAGALSHGGDAGRSVARRAGRGAGEQGSTASAAEILAGALQDHHRAKLLGRRTFGKGSVQTVMPLSADAPSSSPLRATSRPRARSIQRGIEPDLPLPEPPVTAAGHEPTGEQDPEIREAVAFLKTGHTTLATAKAVPEGG